MQIEIIKPIGTCAGVTNAIKRATEIRNKYPSKEVYILGQLVHNDIVIKELKEQNINVIEAPFETYASYLKTLKEGSIVIFPAHGYDEKLELICKQNNLMFFDTTCKMVQKVRDAIKKYIKKGYKILYIGDREHIETKATLSLDKKNIILYENLLDLYHLNTNDKIFVCLQTTLNYNNVKPIIDKILTKFPNAVAQNEICPVARIRQQNILKLSEDVDALLVIGSSTSSNTMKLLQIAKDKYPHVLSLLIEDENSIPFNLLKNKKHVAITSGTSAPNTLVQRVLESMTLHR